MPGQPRGDASFHRHRIDIQIAVVLTTEGEGLSVRREPGPKLVAPMGGQALGSSPLPISDPEISAIDEGHVICTESRLGQKSGIRGVDGERRQSPKGEHRDDGEARE